MSITLSAIKFVIYTFLVLSTGFLIHIYFQNSQSYWLVLSVLLGVMIRAGDTVWERILILVLTGAIAAITSLLAYYVSFTIVSQVIYLFTVTFICIYLSEYYPRMAIPLLVVNLIAILSTSFLANRLSNIERAGWILSAFLLAAGGQLFFLLRFVTNELQQYTIQTIKNLQGLNNAVFMCLLESSYFENFYFFERRLHMEKIKVMQANLRLQEIALLAEEKSSMTKKQILEKIVNTFDKLIDIVIDYSQIRRRVADHSVFQLCNNELIYLYAEIDKTMNQLKNNILRYKKNWHNNNLKLAIERFEENYEAVLKINSADPMVFLLFIDSLKSFLHTIQELQQLIKRFYLTDGK